MRQLMKLLVSSKFSMILLVFFIITIGTATIIENYYDTPTAQLLIFHATWFELMMLVLVVQYIGNQFLRKSFTIAKLPQLMFHFSFVVLIIGGGITRYLGYEGNMHILENQAVNVVYTASPYLQVKNSDRSFNYTSEKPLFFSQLQENYFELEFDTPENESLKIKYRDFIYNARDLYVQLNKNQSIDDHHLDYNNPDQQFPNALLVTVTFKGKNFDIVLFHDEARYIQPFTLYEFDGISLEMTYGPKPVMLPFSLKLNKFTLSKYPGTEIPSASESEVQLIDNRNGLNKTHYITKSQVLDYDGYRFFQTSYDVNEKGTILSLNYDYYGTRITYFGYMMLMLGVLMFFFSKNSRFQQIDQQIVSLRKKRTSMLLALLLFSLSTVYSQEKPKPPVSKSHAESFGELLVQTYDGRFTTVHSLATDFIHKLTGRNQFEFPGKGKMNAMHLFLDIQSDPNYWSAQDLIVVREQSLRDILGVNQKYIPFITFFNEERIYRLDKLSIQAFKKKASEQSSLEREILKVTDRVNIFSMLTRGDLLKIFPLPNSENNKWISWNDPLASKPLSSDLLAPAYLPKIDGSSYRSLYKSYLEATENAIKRNNYDDSYRLLNHMKVIQRQLTHEDLLPSEFKVSAEIFYNEIRIFDRLKYVYAFLGVILLILSFLNSFSSKRSIITNTILKAFVGLTIVSFFIQTFGMALRWFLGGHAPWSNGYEVLLLVAWGAMLAGFSVIRHSKITLAATTLLAFLVLMTASHSYYDPQLTNLNPVLKSVWLIVHVAIITIGYGFLALSFILSLLTMSMSLGKSKKNKNYLSLLVQELTLTNEKLVIIGMFLTAIGTFIGCIWANESWGSYWSWNAKQTWSLIIVLVYGVVLHFKYIPGLQSPLAFNIGSILSFGSVLMTFIGVNYYFTKGLHSYASDDPPIFPIWSWVAIALLFVLIIAALWNERQWKRKPSSDVY